MSAFPENFDLLAGGEEKDQAIEQGRDRGLRGPVAARPYDRAGDEHTGLRCKTPCPR